ncbi:uncharacterized protein BP01DRAFT_354904 [Aspergillus saccharolyticus JOP 1030-1]|uniref:Uncharacterized protein n=1 Tax=Aspergillus saccharolyticus JOP 1030-1 TaxID=1450539 RepID=A0A318ZHQ3_9EURO|nr:hypothetical protein BP01DRAFT_354904 [Aspergillus saccharolyticus JOP 1030-1]PYH47101.1 hypothetical protein BP01DRAFT_354904 [Aspergillus saccharolyticus JOP 1030-1]
MSIYSLPNEVLALLPSYLDNIETFTSASSSCRLLRDNFATASPATILRLAAASAPTFFSPHPHFLVAATARQASDWALGDADRTALLHEALRGGIWGLYDFCLAYAGLTMADIRRLHLARFDILNPLSDRIDKMAGAQWYETENFWDGGVSEPYTIETEADRAAFQIIIYGELFGGSMEAFLAAGGQRPPATMPVHSIETRIEYIKYCVPDWVCKKGYQGFEPPLNVGPYAEEVAESLPGDQTSLYHILTCRRWRRMWAGAMMMIAGEEQDGEIEDELTEEDWRTRLWRDALVTQGLWGMQLVTMSEERVDKKWLEKGRWVREQILKLEGPLESRRIGEKRQIVVSLAPDPSQDVFVCMAGMWRL